MESAFKLTFLYQGKYRQPKKFLVKKRPPRKVSRGWVLEAVVDDLGLILQDLHPTNDSFVVDFLTEHLQQQALGLDGRLIGDDSRKMGTISVWAVRNNPLSLPEILKLVDSQCWVSQEMERLSPKGQPNQGEGKMTYAQVVKASPQDPRNVWLH